MYSLLYATVSGILMNRLQQMNGFLWEIGYTLIIIPDYL